ncbi:unnamed protein product, partial [Mesorhabditis spiculigera]
MVLARVRESAQQAFAHPRWRPFLPILLILFTAIYILFGGFLFRVIEYDAKVAAIQRWHGDQYRLRLAHARFMSKQIFNDTKQLLIIIDKDQSERVTGILNDALKLYEAKLKYKGPDRDSWRLKNAINYAYSQLLTVGLNGKSPATTMGKVFHVPYVLLGVPLLFCTIACFAHEYLVPSMLKSGSPYHRRFHALALATLLYLGWAFIVAIFYYLQVHDSFVPAFFTALTAVFTVQMPVDAVTPCVLFVMLLGTTVALLFGYLVAFFACASYGGFDFGIPVSTEVPDDENTAGQQKFTVVVDQAGDSKLIN